MQQGGPGGIGYLLVRVYLVDNIPDARYVRIDGPRVSSRIAAKRPKLSPSAVLRRLFRQAGDPTAAPRASPGRNGAASHSLAQATHPCASLDRNPDAS